MAIETLEERVETLETRLDSLQRLMEERLPQDTSSTKGGWQAIVGTFADDPLYEDAMQRGREWRDAQSSKLDDEIR